MSISTAISLAWRSLWVLSKQRSEPLWARLAVSSALALAIGLSFMLINGLLTGRAADVGWWRASLVFNLVGCLCVAYVILGFTHLTELLLPAHSLAAIVAAADWRMGLIINLIMVAGTTVGCALCISLYSWLTTWDAWAMFFAYPIAQVEFVVFACILAGANWVWWRLRVRQQRLLHQATESQLRLLQAQIEPHFLFNTLANVQSLMDHEAPRAKQMLETFTDYLRASLGQLRHTDSSLAAELSMAQCYLELLQIRMEERLSFVIEASAEARAAILPTLLLQPLIENAIQHGLEPKIEGGHVRVHATVQGALLQISVEDNGLGLGAPRRSGRASTGMAMANIRSRLQTRYGAAATLSLGAQDGSTRALLQLPYKAQP